MPDPNENKEEPKKEGENSEPKKEEINTPVPPAPAPVPPQQPPVKFPEPKVLEAVIDEKQPPKKGPVPFSFTTPEAIHQKQAEPTKGEIAIADLKKKLTLEELDAQIARDERKDKKDYTIDDYVDTANMFVDFWEAGMMTICRAIARDTSSSAYKFPTETREKLIRQGTKISRKKGWVIPIELLGAGTLLAATADNGFKAADKLKEYKDKKKNETPDKVELNKGGPNKGREKKRGPGNPR